MAAKAVHQNEWQRKLFIRMSGSKSCSSERVAAKAVHQNEWQHQLFTGLRQQQGLFTRTSIIKQWQQGLSTVRDTDGGIRVCPLRETSADRESYRPAATAETVNCIRRPAATIGGRRAAAAKAVDCKKLSSFELKLSWRRLLGESARGKVDRSGSECMRTCRAGWRHRQQC